MIKFTVTGQPVEVINYTDKTTGAGKQLRKQSAYAHVIEQDGTSAPFPEKFSFLLNRDQDAYPAGEYTLHPSALVIDRDGRLSCLPRLTPIKRAG